MPAEVDMNEEKEPYPKDKEKTALFMGAMIVIFLIIAAFYFGGAIPHEVLTKIR